MNKILTFSLIAVVGFVLGLTGVGCGFAKPTIKCEDNVWKEKHTSGALVGKVWVSNSYWVELDELGSCEDGDPSPSEDYEVEG